MCLRRGRVLIVGIRKDIDPRLFEFPSLQKLYTLKDALKAVEYFLWMYLFLKDQIILGKRDVLDLVPAGGMCLEDLPAEMQRQYMGGSYHLGGGKTGMARRMSWDKPSLTFM